MVVIKNQNTQKSINGMVKVNKKVISPAARENRRTVVEGAVPGLASTSAPRPMVISRKSKRFFWIFIGVVLLVASGIYWLIAPSAQVRITLKSEPFVNNIQIKVDAHAVKINPDLYIIPGVVKYYSIEESPLPAYIDIETLDKGLFYKKNEAKTLLFKPEDIKEIVAIINSKSVPPGKVIFESSDDVVEITVEKFNPTRGLAYLTVHTENKIVDRYSLAKVKQDIVGLEKDVAIEYIKNNLNASEVEIIISPGFLASKEKLPYLGERIDISLDIL